jgi:hypothetical protein
MIALRDVPAVLAIIAVVVFDTFDKPLDVL